MDNQSAQAPLLPSRDLGDNDHFVHINKTTNFFLYSLKWILMIAMWLLFIAWLAFIFIYPLTSGNNLVKKWTHDTAGTFLGIEGAAFLIYSCPILTISFLSLPYLIITRKEQTIQEEKLIEAPKPPSYRLSTFPLLVEGPLGVVSAAEFIGILFFAFYIIWAVSAYSLRDLSLFNDTEFTSRKEKIYYMLEVCALSLGLMGIFCLTFLFIPIARGSVLLRLLDIPFGHAVRYHIWLGNVTMFIFSLHGLLYIIAWSIEGSLLQNILEWASNGVAKLAGVIGLSAGVLMWATSLPPVRKKYFEVFFYTHQLYIIFAIFLAFHVGFIFFSMVAGSVFLFMLDRFLRFCQSRKKANVVSVTCLPNGVVKLVIPKPQNLQYNALSFVFLQIGKISWLQWHPFSISSSSLGGENHLSVLIKVLGGWTTKMKEDYSSNNIFGVLEPEEGLHLQSCNSEIMASVEGPYGHEVPHHLMYEKLVLVAGGIGISPFLAVLSDIFHRIRQGKFHLLKNILLVWAVRTSDELPLLSMIDMNLVNPNISNEVDLDILIYVTRESEPQLEEGIVEKAMNSFICPAAPISNGNSMSQLLVGAGNNAWFGTYLISTTIGFIILLCLLNNFYINPYSTADTGWYEGLLFMACMVASVFIFGGLVVGLWLLCGENVKTNEALTAYSGNKAETHKDLCRYLASSAKIWYGSRPDFKDIFGSIFERWGNVDVGVIVCGPWTLESSVAKECRSMNMGRNHHQPIFHFHSHSFSF